MDLQEEIRLLKEKLRQAKHEDVIEAMEQSAHGYEEDSWNEEGIVGEEGTQVNQEVESVKEDGFEEKDGMGKEENGIEEEEEEEKVDYETEGDALEKEGGGSNLRARKGREKGEGMVGRASVTAVGIGMEEDGEGGKKGRLEKKDD
mmetsp:Transcript_4507/g.8142  ORF Transcript_4507/g.8142 Transcript_4507/m.8142 type:complete len:146 (-) Transcript_4507:589-1026(-)